MRVDELRDYLSKFDNDAEVIVQHGCFLSNIRILTRQNLKFNDKEQPIVMIILDKVG